jgi:hypothetical protein
MHGADGLPEAAETRNSTTRSHSLFTARLLSSIPPDEDVPTDWSRRLEIVDTSRREPSAEVFLDDEDPGEVTEARFETGKCDAVDGSRRGISTQNARPDTSSSCSLSCVLRPRIPASSNLTRLLGEHSDTRFLFFALLLMTGLLSTLTVS